MNEPRELAREGVLPRVLRANPHDLVEHPREHGHASVPHDSARDEHAQARVPLGPVHREQHLAASRHMREELLGERLVLDAPVAKQAVEAVERAVEPDARPLRHHVRDVERARLRRDEDGCDDGRESLRVPTLKRLEHRVEQRVSSQWVHGSSFSAI